jgi:hypothetical protein
MSNISKTKQFLVSGTDIILVAKVEYTAQSVSVNTLVNGALLPVVITNVPITTFQLITVAMTAIYDWAEEEITNGNGGGGGGA